MRASFASQDGRGLEMRGAAEGDGAAQHGDAGGQRENNYEDEQRGLGSGTEDFFANYASEDYTERIADAAARDG